MNINALAPATLGFGFGVAMLWAVRSARVDEWLTKLRAHLRSRRVSAFKAVRADDLTWAPNQLFRDKVSYFMKPLFRHPKTDDSVMLVRYPAGQMQPPHIHSHGHGIYVLQGKLVTHKGTYGPGTFVWFPPNEVVSHGASADEDLVILFLRHEDMDINYVHAASR